jgi:membrane-associated protease RseP (regulator of RpoE activity)
LDALGILIFCVALVLSVMLHETGHFVAAKRFGMKCTQYFFGFGPTLWSVQRGETEYGFKAIPAGGFVKIVGMTSLDEVDPEDEPRSFRRAPGWQRLIVLAAGSFMHFLLAAVLIFGVALAIGVENEVGNTTQVGTVTTYVPANETALSNGTVCAGEAKSPAAAAGLKVGDQVTSFDGVAVSTFTGLKAEVLKVKPGTPVTFTVLRDGHSLTLHTALAEVKGYGSFFGMGPVTTTVFQRQSPLDSVKDVGNVGSVIGAAQATGQAVAAPVGWQSKVSYVLLLIAELNIFWGVFNLLPLLPLDGGHIAVVFWERIRAWIARRRGRPDPGPVDYRRVVPPMFAVFAVIIVFTLVVILADIVNPVNFG